MCAAPHPESAYSTPEPPAGSDVAPAHSAKARRRSLVGGLIGTFVEWYDFSIYAALVAAIATAFFPAGNPALGTLATFGVFALTFVTRPLGGAFFGSLGDRIGRRTALSVTVIGMGAMSLLIGILPTYAAIGVAAPILLTLFRLVQGFCAGGELVGATTFVVEHGSQDRIAVRAASNVATSAFAFLAGGLSVLVLRAVMEPAAYQAWGWRALFILGGVLSAVGLYIRLKIEDTPDYQEVRAAGRVETSPVRAAVRSHSREMATLLFIAGVQAVGFFSISTYLVSYLTNVAGMTPQAAQLANTLALTVYVASILVCAVICDRLDKRPRFVVSAALVVVLGVPGFLLAGTGSVAAAVLGQLLILVPLSTITVLQATSMIELFPVAIRYSGAAVSYNLANVLFGGTAGLVATWLVATTGNRLSPIYYILGVVLSCLAGYLLTRGSRRTAELPAT